MEQEYRRTRRHPRFEVEGRIKGRVTGLHDASLVNISLGGALVEHIQAGRPDTVSRKRVSVTCRSLVNRVEVQPDGQRALVYHTGLESIDASEEMRQAISYYIQSNTATANATWGRATTRST